MDCQLFQLLDFQLSFKMKNSLCITFILFLAGSCDLPVENIDYEEKLVAFMNLHAGLPISSDTLTLNLTHEIDQQHEGNESWVSDANAFIIIDPENNPDTLQLNEVASIPGHYVVTDSIYFVQSGVRYQLFVSTADHSIQAETTIPAEISLKSVQVDDLWDCEGNTVVDSIDLHIEDNDLMTLLMAYASGDLSLLSVDTVEYKTANCFTSSFTSMPYFALEWSSEDAPNMLRTTTIALEDTISNVIIDTTLSAHAFKGHMLVDENGNKYWPNPTVWNFSVEEMYYGWLSFYYFGYNMIIIEATDDAFANYYAGDPLQINQYTMPNSNIDGGLGLFSSTSSAFFFVYIKPEEEQ